MVFQTQIRVASRGQGLIEVTHDVQEVVEKSGAASGVAQVFCRHTSCSLVIMENADPSARRDLEAWMNRLVPEGDRLFRHTAEGPDDMPSHIKMALTRTSEAVPFADRRLLLGTWQGIYLWEHRRDPHERTLVVTVVS